MARDQQGEASQAGSGTPGPVLPPEPSFHDEAAAYAALEAILWPAGPVCPHCGSSRKAYALKGGTTRPGLRKCADCKRQFTVKVGTPFESAHLPLHKVLSAVYLFAADPDGATARRFQEALAVSYKTAWSVLAVLRRELPERDWPPRRTRVVAKLGADALARVCEVYRAQFGLTWQTPVAQNATTQKVSKFSGIYAKSVRSRGARSADKSGPKKRQRFGWVRERLVLAAEAAALDIAEEERARAQIYGLLGAALRRAPSAALLQRLGAIEGDDSALGRGFSALAVAARNTTPAAAEEEFNALFIGLSQGEVTPYASYYLTGFLYEKPLARLRGDLARLGIAAAEGVAEPEDHIAALCEVMAGLIDGRFGRPAALTEQRQFFDRHLAPWAGRFFDDLARAKAARFYMPVGGIGRLFIDVEKEAFAMA
ncbi:MAG: molecular chaperone TorD family protein [Alphaproteobacteria bacterium]|nr:molecular chaperone TorD family protein [Alphaproteobacteria bacterium]